MSDPLAAHVVLGDGALSAPHIAEALRAGVYVSDQHFDAYLQPASHAVSLVHWTRVAVARYAAEWLARVGARSVVDVGSGAGKFCVVGALSAPSLRFHGLEQRPRLVAEARALASTFGVVDRVSFVCGTLSKVGLPPADAYYLYNPFGENLFDEPDHIDESVLLCEERHDRDVDHVERQLSRAPAGTFVLTNNGFGGAMPSSYEPLLAHARAPGTLQLWQKRRSA